MVYEVSVNNDSPATEMHDTPENTNTNKAEAVKTFHGKIEPDETPVSALDYFELSKKALKKERQQMKKVDTKDQNNKGAECVKGRPH